MSSFIICWSDFNPAYHQVGTVEQYLEHGPGFIFLYHPALGPLWDVIAQKVRGGALAPGAEVVLEVWQSSTLAGIQPPSSLQNHLLSVRFLSQMSLAYGDLLRFQCNCQASNLVN